MFSSSTCSLISEADLGNLSLGEKSNSLCSQRNKHWPSVTNPGLWKILKLDLIPIANSVHELFLF